MNKMFASLLGSLMLIGLATGADASPQLAKNPSKGPAIAARREAASDFTRNNQGGYSSSGQIVRARDVRTTLLNTSSTGMVKTYRATEKGNPANSQVQKVRKVDGGWKAYKAATN